MRIRNFLALGSGEAVSRIVAFGAYLYIARVLGAEGYGVVAFASAVTLYLTRFADFAIELSGTTEVAKRPDSVRSFAPVIFGARIAMACGLLGVSILLVHLLAPVGERTVLTLYFLTVIPVAFSTRWIYMGLQQMVPIAIWRMVGESVFLGLVVTLVRGIDDIWIVPLALLVGDSLTVGALFLKLMRTRHRFAIRWAPREALPSLRVALPLVGQVILGLLLYNMDVFLVRVFMDATAVGYYSAAYMPISFLGNLAAMYGTSLLPALAAEGDNAVELFVTAAAEAVTVALPIAVGGMLVAHRVILFAFGFEYTQSAVVLQVLLAVLPAVALRIVARAGLVVRESHRILFRATLAGVLVNFVLNLVLINILGTAGAAIATVVAEICVVGLMFWHLRSLGLSLPSLRRLWPAILSVAAMAVAVLMVANVSLAVQVGVGVLAYGAVLGLTGRLGIRACVPVLRV